MSNFNNNAYQSLVADLIGDTFYVETVCLLTRIK